MNALYFLPLVIGSTFSNKKGSYVKLSEAANIGLIFGGLIFNEHCLSLCLSGLLGSSSTMLISKEEKWLTSIINCFSV